MKINTISSISAASKLNAANQQKISSVNVSKTSNISFEGRKTRITAGILAALQSLALTAHISKAYAAPANSVPAPSSAYVEYMQYPVSKPESTVDIDSSKEEENDLTEYVYEDMIPKVNIVEDNDDMVIQRLKHEKNIEILTAKAKEIEADKEASADDKALLAAIYQVIDELSSKIQKLDEIEASIRERMYSSDTSKVPTPTPSASPEQEAIGCTYEDILGHSLTPTPTASPEQEAIGCTYEDILGHSLTPTPSASPEQEVIGCTFEDILGHPISEESGIAPSPSAPLPPLPVIPIVDTFEDIFGFTDTVFEDLRELIPAENDINYDDSEEVKAEKKAENDEIVKAEAEKLLKEAEELNNKADAQYTQAVEDYKNYYMTGEGDIDEIKSRLDGVGFIQSQARRSQGIGTRLMNIATAEGYGAYIVISQMPKKTPSSTGADSPAITPSMPAVDNKTPEEKQQEREKTQNYIYSFLPQENLVKKGEEIDSIMTKKIKNDGLLFKEAERLKEEAAKLEEEGQKEYLNSKGSLIYAYSKKDGSAEEIEIRIIDAVSKLNSSKEMIAMAEKLREIANSDSWSYYFSE